MNAKLKVFSTCLPQPLALCAANLGDKVLRLQDEPVAILKGLHRCGRVNVVMGNDVATVQRTADFQNLCIGAGLGLGTGMSVGVPRGLGVGGSSGACGYLSQSGSLLALHLGEWHTVFAVVAPLANIPARSLLFFDHDGHMIQCVSVTCGGFAFEELVCAMLHPEQHSVPLLMPADVYGRGVVDRHKGGAGERAAVRGEVMEEVDVDVLERDWSNACDDDCFERMLQRHGIDRLTALRGVRDSYALPVQPDSVLSLLGMAAEQGAGLSFRIANKGVAQTLFGTSSGLHFSHRARSQDDIRQASIRQATIKVSDSALLLTPSSIASAWRVRRRGDTGIETVIELFDRKGRPALYIKGAPERVVRSAARDVNVRAIEGADDADRWVQLVCDSLIPLSRRVTRKATPFFLSGTTQLH